MIKEHRKEDVLVFVHFPKVGGNTLHAILEGQYPQSTHISSNGLQTLNEILTLSEQDMDNIDVIRGHMNFGVHKLFARPAVYISMLRDPVERVISHYYHALRDPRHPLYDKCVSNNMKLEDFVFQMTDNDNGQVRALAGFADQLAFFRKDYIPFGKCNNDILETAKANLSNFKAVGLMERFDESLILFKRILKWELPPLYEKSNVANNRLRLPEISQKAIDLITEINQYDLQIYAYASDLLQKRIDQEGDSFNLELNYFGLLNKSSFDVIRLNQQHEQIEHEHQRLQQEYQEILHSKAVVFAQELAKHAPLMKITSTCYRVASSIYKLFSRMP